MKRKSRRVLTGLAATGALAGVLTAGGIALASTNGTAQTPVATTASTTGTGASVVSTASDGKGGVWFLRRHHVARLVFRTAATYLGLSREELHARLHAGQSLATVATAQGKSVSGLESAIMAAVTKRVDASKLTATRKTDVISDVQNNLNAFVSMKHPFAVTGPDRRLGKATSGGTGSTSAT
jgi:hypothetical protein